MNDTSEGNRVSLEYVNRVVKQESTESGFAGKPSFTGSGLVRLLCGPNSPAAHSFQNRWVIIRINLDVPPFKNGRPDEGSEAGDVEDLAKREIIGMSVDQDVGRCELWHDRDAIGNKCKIN